MSKVLMLIQQYKTAEIRVAFGNRKPNDLMLLLIVLLDVCYHIQILLQQGISP